jgi:membrane protein required for colicin V production
LSGADWIILAIVVLSALTAFAQGFFHEVFSLAGVILGYLLAAWGYRAIAAWYTPLVSSPWVADIAGFLTIFVAVALLASLAGRLTRWLMKEVGLRWFDRTLGAAFGLARGILVATVLVLAVAAFAPGSQVLARSQLAPYLLVIGRGASWLAPAEVRLQFRAGVERLRELRRQVEDRPGPPVSDAKADNRN